jgi:translation initiation factor 2 subunit 1|tara:strand:- start:73 stop:876 length:804 start_codon:yes stop_codon:yes gene_type:complete
MTVETQEFPEVGEIVIATIKKTGDHGAYVSLDEYDNIQGFLHISEIAPGWVRKVTKYVKEGDKKVLLVKKIQQDRAEIDLSLKQISKEQRKKKLLDVKRFEKEQGILKNIQDKVKLSSEEIDQVEEKLLSKYNSVYEAIIEIGTKNINVIDDLDISKKIKEVIEEFSKKIKLPTVEIRGVLEMTSSKSDGIEIIRKILLDAIKESKNEKIEISYLGAPRYRLSIIAQDFKTAEKTLKPILEKIEKNSSKLNGTYKFSREDSKKTGEG